jgi:hypothetical protein
VGFLDLAVRDHDVLVVYILRRLGRGCTGR